MLAVGVDVGGTKCLGVAIVDGEVAFEARVATPEGAAPLLEAVVGIVTTLSGEAGEPVDAVGIGVPGLVDRAGVLHFAPNLKGATGLDVRSSLEQRLGVPVAVDNDATCAAWGEHELGAARALDDVVLVTLGTGIGGGIIANGEVVRGAHGFGGEIGHIVIDPHGPPCPCGRRGCWEQFSSGSGLGRLAREAAHAGKATRVVALAGGLEERVHGEHVTGALAEGDEQAVAIMGEFAWWLAIGLANIVNIFDPEAIVIGGGLIDAGASLLEPARTALARELEAQAGREMVPVLPATLGGAAGAIGAAFLGVERLRRA